ncbi:hypothetical protein EMCRGX_G014591 [Ephydatia muelleri]
MSCTLLLDASECQAPSRDQHSSSPEERTEAPPDVTTPQPIEEKLGSQSVTADTEDQQRRVAKLEPQNGPSSGVAAIKNQYVLKRPLQEPETDDDESQPPPGKRKKRGQNKQRPRAIIPYSQLLCPKLHSAHGGEGCRYGDKCRYLHDVARYMAVKPPDIGDRCYVYDTFGKCGYGAACRFALSHLTPDFANVVNEALYDPNRPSPLVNAVPKGLQENLRKKRFAFPRSDAFLRKLQAGGGLKAACDGNVTGETEEDRLPNEANSRADTDPGGKQGLATAGCCEDLVGGEPGSVQPEPRGKGEGCCETGAVPEAASANGGAGILSEAQSSRTMEKSEGSVVDVELDFRGKLYLAPLTTVGNLPFRRICKGFGADITCGEMALCSSLLQGQQSEWALMKRHESEDFFGVQVCGSFADSMARCAELLNSQVKVDFVDINAGCPIDMVFKKGAGCALMGRQNKFHEVVCGMVSVLDCPLTVKMRTGVYDKSWNAHRLAPKLRDCGVSMVTIHGRSREQRYTKLADWEYIETCAQAANPIPVFGNGDILSFEDYYSHLESSTVSGIMIARGALVKPWLFTEIKERRHWDISSSERLELLRTYTNYGLEHWGSDFQGVENTRKFLLEWLSFLYRYIPVGVLERVPQRMNERPPFTVAEMTSRPSWDQATARIGLRSVRCCLAYPATYISSHYFLGNTKYIMSDSELACVYAALILYDAQLPITADKITKLAKAAGVAVEPVWPSLFSRALEGKDVGALISNVGSGAAATAASAAPPAAAAAEPAKGGAKEDKKEEKKEKEKPKVEEKEESDDDMGFGLFD